MILSLQEELRSLDKFRLEKEKTEKLIGNLTNSVNSLKEDLERKTKKLREHERLNLEMRMPNNAPSERSGNKNAVSENSLDKLRDKVIRTLEVENRKMKEKLKKMNYEQYKLMENNIENDVGKNVPTNHGMYLFICLFFFWIVFLFNLILLIENHTQSNQNENNENNNNEEEGIKTPSPVNASAENLIASSLHDSNLVNMGIEQSELKQEQNEAENENNQNASRGEGKESLHESRNSKSNVEDMEEKIIHKSNLELENNENNESLNKQYISNHGDNNFNNENQNPENNVDGSKIYHTQKNSMIENMINDKSNMENMNQKGKLFLFLLFKLANGMLFKTSFFHKKLIFYL